MTIKAVDLETTGLDPYRHSIVSVSTCGGTLVPNSQNWTKLVRDRLYSFLANSKNTVVVQNSVFDCNFLIRNGFKINARIEDTMIGAHILEPNLRVDLHSLVKRYLWPVRNEIGIEIDLNWKDALKEYMAPRKRAFKKEHGRVMSFQDLPQEVLHKYGKLDSLYCLLVWIAVEQLLKQNNLYKNYETDMKIVPIVLKMCYRGVKLDTKHCREQIKILQKENRMIAAKFPSMKLSSPKVVGEKVLPKMGVKIMYFTEKGNIKTDENSMRRYAKKFPKVMDILDFRKNNKSIGSYYQAYLNRSYHGVVHPTLRVAAAKTGRLSCADPNLQQMKRKGKIRSSFIPRPGYLFLCADYDQIEMRLIACKSRDPALLKTFKRGDDVHITTMKLLGIDKKKMVKVLRGNEPRFVAKQLNYKLWYGMGSAALSNELVIEESIVRNMIQKYWAVYSYGRAFFDLVASRSVAQGEIRDEFGRMYKPENEYSGYKCVNYLIQGAASTIMKNGMIKVDPMLNGIDARMLLVIHDEFVIEVKDDPAIYSELVPKITTAVNDTKGYEIPIVVTLKWSRKSLAKDDLRPLKELEGIKIQKGNQ